MATGTDREGTGATSSEGYSSTDAYLSELERTTPAQASIPVHISYEIIRLFSEGLYQSPQKAIEELVSNGYDAGATSISVLLPEGTGTGLSDGRSLDPLWVIDNGSGMDADGFVALWRVADSPKKNVVQVGSERRLPIGQFGIGKLAAYVLAWRLTHISKAEGVIRFTSMNFRRLDDVHQYSNTNPVDLDMRVLTEEQAKRLLAPVEDRDPAAWDLLFGASPAPTWTAAALSDFKNLYDKLSSGRLSWVLRTGIPLHSQFKISLNGVALESSKVTDKVIQRFTIGTDDRVAENLNIKAVPGGIEIPGIDGTISGEAIIYEKRLDRGKSDELYHRSNGFFVSVRSRIINLEDELFGIEALNHAAWSRFSMTIQADGLREHLLSSREGVRESDPVRLLRTYMHRMFNACRASYEDWMASHDGGIDLSALLTQTPSAYISEPLLDGVETVLSTEQESYYMAKPPSIDDLSTDEKKLWLAQYAEEINSGVISKVIFEKTGEYDRAVRYFPDTRILLINADHPFVSKLLSSSRTNAGATLFGSAELLIDVALQGHGLAPNMIVDFLADRDRLLRLVAGDQPSTAAEVMRQLQSALKHETALERATGLAFRVLGFEYEKRGGNKGGPDGVLYARLGRGTGARLADYKVVYDSKQTNQPSVPADKIDIASIEDFRGTETAQYSFFLAVAYEGESNPDSKINRKVTAAADAKTPITLLRVADLQRLVELHYRYGVTLTRLRTLFESAHTVQQVSNWLDELEDELTNLEPQVPLLKLFQALESAKRDQLATPDVTAARYIDPELRKFEPEKLTASLAAVQTIVGPRWLEVETSGVIRLHATAAQVVAEVERLLHDMFGVDASALPEIK